jgi:hypothetical protein
MAARLTRYADTVDVAGVAFRVVCRYPKPRFWARSRPEFLTTRRPDVTVEITYDDDFRRRARRAVGEHTVDDAPRVRRCGRGLLVTTGYYRATVDVPHGRAAVRIASGFGVANLMRTLSALWLLERGTLLLRADRLDGNGCALVLGGAARATHAATASGAEPAGYVAVTPRPDGMATHLTPFVDHDGTLPAPGRAGAGTLEISSGGDGSVASEARVLAALLPAVWQADRRRAAVARTLDLAARVVSAPGCRLVAAGPSRAAGTTAVG